MAHSSTDDPRRPRALVACAFLLLVGAAVAAWADPLGIIPAPPLISPGEAAAHVGEVVDLDATVSEAKGEAGRVVLRTAGAGDEQVRIVIVRALVGPSVASLVERYAGQRVRARGRIDDFGDELEIVVSDPGLVAVVGAEDDAPEPVAAEVVEPTRAAPAPRATVASRPQVKPAELDERAIPAAAVAVAPSATPAAATRAIVPVVASAREAAPEPTAAPEPRSVVPRASEPPPVAPLAAAATPPPADEGEDCRAAQRTWSGAAAAARAPVARLATCLDGARPPCATLAAEVRRALAELAAAEERLRWVCAEGER